MYTVMKAAINVETKEYKAVGIGTDCYRQQELLQAQGSGKDELTKICCNLGKISLKF